SGRKCSASVSVSPARAGPSATSSAARCRVFPGAAICAAAGTAAITASRVSSALRKVMVLARIVPEHLGLHPMSDKRELLILGGGLVGMTLALAAARKGLASHVVDRADPAALTAEHFDGRASAISTASWNLFTNIGLAARLEPHGCPIASIA